MVTQKKRNRILTVIAILFLVAFIGFAENNLDLYIVRILNVCAIYAILGMSMNLINGFTGLFSLGHAGFMAVGAYTTALLTIPPAVKKQIFYLAPLIEPLDRINLPFPLALLVGGILAALVGALIAAPTLRLKGDYLAIATLGFAEIIRVVFTNTQTITNGALGLKGIPALTNLWWSFGTAAFTLLVLLSLINSSYGRALKAIREDEIAAESMGINLAKHKTLSFVIGAFFAGIGGGLLGNLLGTIDPKMFSFTFTFNILLIIVLGGMGSLTGSIISAFIVTIANEYLRFLDERINLGFFVIEGKVGMRSVVFSALLMFVVLFYRHGLMGSKEFSWDRFLAGTGQLYQRTLGRLIRRPRKGGYAG
ncbi:MAG TPA: branched-chain amino acid ABC transporter permease [Capillibacterium sp.]